MAVDPTAGWFSLGSAAIGAVGKVATGQPAGPSQSDQLASIGIDFSNWTVSTGNSRADATNSNAAVIPDWLKFAALGLAAVVAVRWITKKN